MTSPHVIMIDNYDSFTFNLVQYFQELGAEVSTYRNDEKTIEQLLAFSPDLFVISPGPSTPENAGVSLALVKVCAEQSLPLFGVCLGHQCIGQHFGGKIVRADLPMHGKVSSIQHSGKGAFKGLNTPFTATRYHSLVIDPASMPKVLEVTATSDDGVIQGIQHLSFPIEGVQFHPESVLTPDGKAMLRNVLEGLSTK